MVFPKIKFSRKFQNLHYALKVTLNSVSWEIFHEIFSSADLFQIHLFWKILSEISECQTVWIRIMSGLIWVRTVCIGYQQMTLLGKELMHVFAAIYFSTMQYYQITPISLCLWFLPHQNEIREGSGSVVECLTGDRGATGSSLTGITALCPWARHINPSLVLVQPRKTIPI